MPYEIKTHTIFTFHKTFLFLIMIYCLVFKTQCFNFKQVGRNSVSRIINERSSYSFVLDRTTDNSGVTTAWNSQSVPSNGNVSVQFPSQYVLTGTQTCNSIVIVSGITNIQTFSPTGYSCVVAGNRLVFVGSLTSISDFFIRNISLNYGNVLNPSPAFKTGEFTGYLGNDVAVANGNTWIQLTAASFSSCYITFGNGSFVNQTNPAIFNFTLLNQLNTSSSIRVTFPSLSKVWTNDISQSILPIRTGSMSCTGLTNSLTNPTCTGNYAAFTVQASSIFSSVISSGQMVSFQINNFISPPTLQPADSIRITSLTNGFEVDTCLTTISDLKPKLFESLTIIPINGQMTVNQNVGIRINMTFSDTIDQNDAFRITFPTGLGVSYTSVSTSGSSQGVSSLNGQVLSVSQNVNFNVVYYKDYFMVINFYTMKAPPSTKQSDPIIVEILRNGYQKMIGSATMKAIQSTLQCSVSPQSLLVSAQTLYVFTITLNDRLSSGGWLEIFFPSEIVVNSSVSIASATGVNVNSHPVLSLDSLLGKVSVSSLNSSSSFINGQTFTVTIGTITNPGSTKPSGSFSIKSYYQSGSQYLVAVGTCNGVTAISGVLKTSDISITKSSDIVLAANVDYRISFVTNYAIPQNGIIKIEIPNDIGIDLNNLQSNCYQTINSSSLVLATCSAVLNSSTKKYQLTITSIALNANLSGNSSISINLQGICTNPDTTRNIVGFTINTFTSDNFIIQGANTGISTKANTPAQCLTVSVNRNSNKNSETTNYTISLKQPSNLLPSSYLIITIPTQLQLTNTTSCVDLTGTTTLTCTISSNIITVQFPAQNLNNMTLFGIILTNVVNTPSYQPLNQNFALLTKTPDNLNRYCQYNNPFSFQNNVPSLFSSIDGAFSPKIFNQLTSLIINFTPSSRLTPNYLIVSVATQLIVESLSCSFQGVAGGVCTQTATNTIKVQGTFTSNSMQFTLGGIRAPKFSPSVPQYSSVSSFSSLNYKIDESVNLISFIVKCTLPCKTCTDGNVSECLSCYQDITISTSIYYLSSLKSCFSVCPEGYFADTSVLTCTACSSVCNTCSMSPNNCTSCKVNSTLKYFYISTGDVGTCLSQCPTFYYPNALNNCAPCQSPCNDCTSKTNCVSCISPFYMFNGSCTSQCPAGTTVPNDATRKCDLCSSICATCSGNINNCVSCSADAAFYNGTCTLACPPPLVINMGQCAGCDPICKQCSLRASNCTKCDTSSTVPYYFNFTCLPDCPSQYYKDLLNGMCRLCSDLNIGCRFCSSVSTCISCDAGFIFLNNKCYNYTPNGYYNENGYAKPCNGDCATCVDYATKCTSCKNFNLDGYDCVPTCPSTKVPVNKTCIPCLSPCLTCSNIPTNCTSCVPNLSPKVFLNNYYCTETCPDYTFPNLTTSKCDSCKSPCLKCTSLSSCLSCVNGKFLLDTSCYDTCPNGYIGVNKVCQPCTSPCMTCEITSTRCLSCQDNFYLYNSSSPSCIQDCSTVNLYPNPILQICTGCQSPCVTCSITSTTCTSCSQSMILFNNSCISSCPTGFYQQASSCITCPSPCATCTSSTVCQSCAFSFYFLLNYCVSSCPKQYPVITSDGKCQKCSDNKCKNCTQNDYCQECLQPYFLHLGTCLQRCPTDYNEAINSTNNFRQCVYSPPVIVTPNITANITITETLKSGGNLFPVPLVIASAFIGVATIMSKFQNHFTFISGVLYSLWGLTQWAAVALMLWYFYQSYGWNHIQFYILAGSFAFLYLLNFLALLIQNIYLLGDVNFNKWLIMGNNKCFYYFVSITSFFTTHKFKNFIFCKMFNFVFLKAKLDFVQQFRVFNAFSFLSFLSSAGILFGMGLTFWTYEQTLDQKLMFFIDATVLTAVNIVLAILNSRKDADFFEQKNQDGFIIHKRIQDYDQLLYGTIMPYESEQKFDHFQTTGKKLITPYETRYKNLQSDISEQSVRVIDISIQAEQILGDQSVITHLNDDGMSDLDFFERKQVSIQFDQPPIQVQDKSISMMEFKNEVHDKSVSMMQVQNHEVSVQMENISQNEISVQVNNDKLQVSVQYGPNVLDHSIGMSRQQAEISIQANPVFEQVSIQYSAKPVFVNIDQEYKSENDEITLIQNVFDQAQYQQKQQKSQYFSRIVSQKSQLISQQQEINNEQSYLTTRIKKPDELLQPQLQLDINQKLMKRKAQLRIIEEEERQREKLRIISDFQKKQALQLKPINYQVNKVIQEVFVTQQRNQIIKVNKRQEDKIHNDQQSGTIMDSKLDILNIDRPKQFQSSQSRVQQRLQSQNTDGNQSIGGQKSQQEFIEMLSSNKMTSQNKDQSSRFNQTNNKHKYQNNHHNIFTKNTNRVLNIPDYEELQPSNQISLNMTEQIQQNKKPQNPHFNTQKPNGINFIFQNKNQLYLSDNQDLQQQDLDIPIKHQSSKQYSKSISTKNMTRINKNQLLSKRIEQGSLLNSSNEIQNSFNSDNNFAEQIVFSPIKALTKNINNINFINKNQNYLNDQQYNQDNNDQPSQYSQNFPRNLKSATISRNHSRVPNIQQDFNEDSTQNDIQYQVQNEKQQPLPLPQDEINKLESNQMQQLEFGDSQKVLVSPLNSQEIKQIEAYHSQLPMGVNKKFSKMGTQKRSLSKNQNKTVRNVTKKGEKRSSKSKEKPVQNELLNPSTSIKGRNITKQLQRQERKAQNRRKNIELMEGMLQRPSNNKKLYSKEEEQQRRRSDVQKIYLNRHNFMSNK